MQLSPARNLPAGVIALAALAVAAVLTPPAVAASDSLPALLAQDIAPPASPGTIQDGSGAGEAEQAAEQAPTASEVFDAMLTEADAAWSNLRTIDPVRLLRNSILSLLAVVVLLAFRYLLLRIVRRLRQRFADREKDDESAAWQGLHRVVNIFLAIIALLLLANIWGFSLLALIEGGPGAEIAKSIGAMLLVILLSMVAWHLSEMLIHRAIGQRVEEQKDRRSAARLKTLVPVLNGLARTVILALAGLLILSELGVNLGPLLAGAGIVGLAVGFGAQSLVKDFLVGVMLLLEDAASIGDVVKVAGHAGLVENMGVRVMRLRDLEGVVHFIPYSSVDTVQNYTKDFAYALLDVGIAYRESVDEVIKTLRALADEMRSDDQFGKKILDDLEVLGVDAFADSAVVVKVRIKTQPIEQWSVAREFRRRMKNRFDELDIEIPFPHRTLYFGIDKEGKAPPALVDVQREKDADEK